MIEPFGPGAVVVREMPAMLGEIDVAALVRDLADEIAEWDEALPLKERLDACRRHHGLPRLGARRPPPQAARR